MKVFLFCFLYVNYLVAGDLQQVVPKQYELSAAGRTLIMSVVSAGDVVRTRETRLTSIELLGLFPEKEKVASIYESQDEVVVAVILARQLFVYGKDWGHPKSIKYRFLGQWLDHDGKAVGGVSSFRNPKPALSPTLRLVAQKQDGLKISRKGGFGFICYDIKEQTPSEARFLKLKVLKERESQPPAADVLVFSFDLVMELSAPE